MPAALPGGGRDFAGLAGRENVAAGAGCGFSSPAAYTPRSTRRSSGRSPRPWPKARRAAARPWWRAGDGPGLRASGAAPAAGS